LIQNFPFDPAQGFIIIIIFPLPHNPSKPTFPFSNTGLSWTDGSNHVLAWQATPDATSVDISLVDDKNETVSQLGSYGMAQNIYI
jgi:hypothetical protein